MVMPLADLRAIYELLFRDGVIVAKKDKRPQSMHPDVKGVTNLKVIRAMGSLKSKGCVRETFAWKHAYYYLTNEGITYLRDYLHLPPEIVPAPYQCVRRPASSARVHTVKGPTSYIPKPKPGRESQETVMDRHIYRHRRVGEEREQPERPPKNFRGLNQCDASICQPGIQIQTICKRDKTFCRGEERWAKEGSRKSFGASCLPTEDRPTRCPDPVKEAKLPVSLVLSSSILPKFSKETSTVHTVRCAPLKEVLQKFVKITSAHPPAAFKESECVKMQEATVKKPTEELIQDVTKGETSNLALEVLVPEFEPGEHAMVNRTIPLLAELTEKDIKDEECVLEEADVVTEDTVEKLSCDVEMMKQLNVEVFDPVTKAETPKSDPDNDSETPPLTATVSFRNLTEEKMDDHDIVDIEDTQEVKEKTIPMKAISGFHVASETLSSADFEAGCPGPVVPSEGPVAALKTTRLQGDQYSLIEDPEKEEDVQRLWPDFLEGLSLS